MNKKKYSICLFLSIIPFQGCCSSQNLNNNISDTKQNKNIVMPFPRGVIETTITLNEMWSNEQNNYCKAAINIVHKTGGGIRPIAENTFYTFVARDELFEQLKNEMGKTIKCRITEVDNLLKNNTNEYKIITIIKK